MWGQTYSGSKECSLYFYLTSSDEFGGDKGQGPTWCKAARAQEWETSKAPSAGSYFVDNYEIEVKDETEEYYRPMVAAIKCYQDDEKQNHGFWVDVSVSGDKATATTTIYFHADKDVDPDHFPSDIESHAISFNVKFNLSSISKTWYKNYSEDNKQLEDIYANSNSWSDISTYQPETRTDTSSNDYLLLNSYNIKVPWQTEADPEGTKTETFLQRFYSTQTTDKYLHEWQRAAVSPSVYDVHDDRFTYNESTKLRLFKAECLPRLFTFESTGAGITPQAKLEYSANIYYYKVYKNSSDLVMEEYDSSKTLIGKTTKSLYVDSDHYTTRIQRYIFALMSGGGSKWPSGVGLYLIDLEYINKDRALYFSIEAPGVPGFTRGGVSTMFFYADSKYKQSFYAVGGDSSGEDAWGTTAADTIDVGTKEVYTLDFENAGTGIAESYKAQAIKIGEPRIDEGAIRYDGAGVVYQLAGVNGWSSYYNKRPQFTSDFPIAFNANVNTPVITEIGGISVGGNYYYGGLGSSGRYGCGTVTSGGTPAAEKGGPGICLFYW